MADAGGLDLDQHFAIARPFQIDLDDFQRLIGGKGNGGAGLHGHGFFLGSSKFSIALVRSFARHFKGRTLFSEKTFTLFQKNHGA